MSMDCVIEISIPTDNEGFSLLQCSFCGEYFKVKSEDYNDEGILWVFCPNCGLIAESYLTEAVVELASVMFQNKMENEIYQGIKKMGRKMGGGSLVSISSQRPIPLHESPLYSTIESLAIYYYRCCGRTAKVRPSQKIVGSYCLFCGVRDFAIEQS